MPRVHAGIQVFVFLGAREGASTFRSFPRKAGIQSRGLGPRFRGDERTLGSEYEDNILVALDRRVHGDVAAPFVCQVLAEFEVLAPHRHFGLALEFPWPVAEIITVPWRLRRERRQAQPFPDRLGLLHELALGQRDRRVGALERGIDQHGGAFAAVAQAARYMAWILVRPHHLLLSV